MEKLMMLHKYESFLFCSLVLKNQKECPRSLPKIFGLLQATPNKRVCQNPNGEAKVTHLAAPRHFSPPSSRAWSFDLVPGTLAIRFFLGARMVKCDKPFFVFGHEKWEMTGGYV